MATAAENTWRVFLMSEDRDLDKIYNLSPTTTLQELLKIWRDDLKVFGHWKFWSADGHTEYENDQLTLEAVGESFPNTRTVTLQVKLSDKPTPPPVFDISVYVDGKCHELEVRPNCRLNRIIPRVHGRQTSFEYNGKPLCLNKTVQQAGLKNKAVIYESSLKISVKLSSGYVIIILMPTESLICQLKAKVASLEAGEFSLKSCGRTLQPHESVKDIKGLVEVSSSTFVVHINGERITWRTATGEMKFTDFVFQLSQKYDMDRETLESAGYCCVGCGRTISKSEEDFQLIENSCCREKSLKLEAKFPSGAMGVRATQDRNVRRMAAKKLVSVEPLAKHVCSSTIKKELRGRLSATSANERLIEIFRKIGTKDIANKGLNDLYDFKQEFPDHDITSFLSKTSQFFQQYIDKNLKNIATERERAATGNAEKQARVAAADVKLLVFYWVDQFEPLVSRPEIEQKGKYLWRSLYHIKCHIDLLVSHDGWVEFDVLRDALSPLFSGPKIQRIMQERSTVGDREVAQVTSLATDEVQEEPRYWRGKEWKFCDSEGKELQRTEVKAKSQRIMSGQKVLICGGDRRTVVVIFKD